VRVVNWLVISNINARNIIDEFAVIEPVGTIFFCENYNKTNASPSIVINV
jgi:hypothetical protein